MKCYYHNDRDAVATCRKCGKAFCKECFDTKLHSGLCDECLDTEVQPMQSDRFFRERDALVDTIGELLITSVIGILLGALFVWLLVKDKVPPISDIASWAEYIGPFFMAFFVPFGWRLLNAIGILSGQFNIYAGSSFGIITSLLIFVIKVILKATICMLLGPISFAYQIIRWIVLGCRLRKRRKALHN